MDLKDLSDEDVAVLVRTKDQKLYRELVERYQGKIIKYIGYLIDDRPAAQDVFIKAFANLWSFNPGLKFSSWLCCIAHNQAVNFIKKHKKEFLIDAESVSEALEDESADILRKLQREEAARLVEKCLNQLAVMYREPRAPFFWFVL